MKFTPCFIQRKALTLVEIMVSTALVSGIGLAIIASANYGLNAFAKNVAVNTAHAEARSGVARMLNDLHSSLSIPQLVDENRDAITGEGPSAGIMVHQLAGGPFPVTATVNAGASVVRVGVTSFTPEVGQYLLIPSHRYEARITAVGNLSGGSRNITLATNAPMKISVPSGYDPNDTTGSSALLITAMVSDKITYLVTDEELRFYPRETSSDFTVIARGITSTSPFSTPTNATGAPHARQVAAVNLSTADSTSSNRDYLATNMFIDSWIPQRARIAISK